MSGAEAVYPNFASGLAAQFEMFRAYWPGAEIVVIVSLADNSSLHFVGLNVLQLDDHPGCIMLSGTSLESKSAVVVREEYVCKVEFAAEPEPGAAFGF